MNQDQIVLLIVAVATAAAALGIVYKRLNIRGLPTMTDRDFLRSYWKLNEASIDPQRVLRERELVASVLGVPRERLTPDQTKEDLRRLELFSTDFEVAWSDLLDELAEDRRAAGLPLGKTPETLGAVVCAFAEVDAAVRSRR
jgi:hypothetical protein